MSSLVSTPVATNSSNNTSRRLVLTSPPSTINTSAGEFFDIPEQIIKEVTEGCHSHRNLAGRLATRLFTLEEMKTSNYRGVKKNTLDKSKTAAIRRCCISKFPPYQHESEAIVDMDIREGVDEMCRRSNRKDCLVLN